MANSKRARSNNPTKRTDHITAYLMIAPSLILLGIFVFYPLGLSLTKVFVKWNFHAPDVFVGLDNFRFVLNVKGFWQSYLNILVLALIGIPIGTILTFLLAHVLKGLTPKFGAFAKTVIYSPYVLSPIAVTMCFLFFFDYSGGIINVFRMFVLHEPRISFLTDDSSIRLIILTVVLWSSFG